MELITELYHGRIQWELMYLCFYLCHSSSFTWRCIYKKIVTTANLLHQDMAMVIVIQPPRLARLT